MSDQEQQYQRVVRSLPTSFGSRAQAFRNLYTSGDFHLDLYTVDRILQQNDQELTIEIISMMLDWLHVPEGEKKQTTGFGASYNAIINRLGVNQGAIPINQEYLAPLLALLPDGAISAAGIPCRRELADIIRILRTRTDWTSETFVDAAHASTWQLAYTDLSELYAVSLASDVRIEALHYGKLFELLFFRTDASPSQSKTSPQNDDPASESETAKRDENNADEDEDAEAEAEQEIIDPINEDVSTFHLQQSLNEFCKWIGFDSTGTIAQQLMLSQQASQISQFLCGLDYYHAVSSIFGVIFSLIQKQQRHLNFRLIYMFSQFFFENDGRNFSIPSILADYEAPQIKGINIHREEQIYMLSYERKMREMNAKSPDEPDHDIGITKRCTTMPFLLEYRLMFISSMYEAATFNGGTHLNATYGYHQHLEQQRAQMAELNTKLEEANGDEGNEDEREEKLDEIQSLIEDFSPTLEVSERFYGLIERFHETMYSTFNCKFIPHTCIIVAWIISIVDGDKASQDIIEKFFGINATNWKEDYDEQLYYETLQKTCATSVEDCGLDFTWATPTYCEDLEQARIYNYNIAHPCSAYDSQIYRVLAQLTMLDHVGGIDWILDQDEKNTLQDIDPTVIYGRLSLFAFASQLDEANLTMTKALVKRKAKVVVNHQFSESSNIFVTLFCLPHISDDQCLEMLQYWHGFCARNPKTNKMNLNPYEFWTLINKSWAMRYTRSTRLQSLRFIAENVLPAATAQAMVTSKEPNFLSLLFSTLISQSSYAEINPSGNTSSRFGDFACIAYEQELLGAIYSILFPNLQAFLRAFQLVQSPIALFTPIFVHQSKFAFDYLFFELKFPAQIQFIPFLINCMLPSCDWASCIDIQSVVLQYQQHLWSTQNSSKKKKAKKGAKKGAKKTFAQAVVAEDETPVADTTPAPATELSIDASTLRSGDAQFFSFTNSSMIMAMGTHELNTSFQMQTLTHSALSNKHNKKQLEVIQSLNQSVCDAIGEENCQLIENKPENEFSVETFDNPANLEKVNSYTFKVFNKHVLAPYKHEMVATALKYGENKDAMSVGTQLEDLLHTCLSPDKHLEHTAKYDLLGLNTQVIDALIWYVDKNEKIVSEEYGGCTLSYAFVLYTLACTLTLFIQESTAAYQKYIQTPGKSEDDPECPKSPAQQLVELYLALVSSLSVPQASPIYQTLQLLFTPSQPFPVAYQHFLIRVQSAEVRGFYNPWVQNLYARYANIRMVGEFAIDLERLVQNSPRGRLLLGVSDEALAVQNGINARITWNLDTITTEYTATPLYQVVLSAIMTECVSQSYINTFQQHYPLRMQYIQTLMRALYSRGQQPTAYCTHTYKFAGLSGLQHIVDLLGTVNHVPLPLVNVLFNLFPAIDMTTTIATAVDVENVQQLWDFYASKRLSSQSDLVDRKVSLLSHGSHPSWMLDLLDVILSRQSTSTKSPQCLTSLAKNIQDFGALGKSVTDTDLYVATNNPILGPFLSLSQYYTPIVSTNEILTMNFWAQLMMSFSSLAAKSHKFFVLAPSQGEKSGELNEIDFTPQQQFTLLSTDPTWAAGIAKLVNKYCTNANVTPEAVEKMLFALLQHSTHNFVVKHDEQQEYIGTEYSQEQVMGFNMNQILDGTAKPLQTKNEQEQAAMFNLPTPSSTTSFNIGGSALDSKKSGGKGMMALAKAAPQPAANNTAPKTDTATPIETKSTDNEVNEPQGKVAIPEPQVILETNNPSAPSSGLSSFVTVGAVVGLVGAALYAGYTYLQGHQKTTSTDDQAQ